MVLAGPGGKAAIIYFGGRRTLAEALQAVEDEFPIKEYRAFIDAIALSIERGAPLVTTLGDMSNTLRSEIKNELPGRGLRTATPMVLGMGIAFTVARVAVLDVDAWPPAPRPACLSIPLARTLEMLPVNWRRL